MCIRDSLLLLLNTGYNNNNECNHENNNNRITVIGCNYLKDIRHELLEEDNRNPTNNFNNEIIHVDTEVEGIPAKLMIDTGSNVSIISTTELERIQQECGRTLPTLPLNNIVLLGATGRQNKTIRRQVSASVMSCGIAIDMEFFCLLYTSIQQ